MFVIFLDVFFFSDVFLLLINHTEMTWIDKTSTSSVQLKEFTYFTLNTVVKAATLSIIPAITVGLHKISKMSTVR